MNQPRLVISGLSGSSGKTLVSLSLARIFTRLGLTVQPYKKGPDYIDAAWLSLAARREAANIDPYFLTSEEIRTIFIQSCLGSDNYGRPLPLPASGEPPCDLAIIEGNRGLYDGRDVTGSCSTAHVAKVLQAPVLIALNCAKMTRTAAALVAGIQSFDPTVRIGGVLLNNTGSARHAMMVRNAIETYTDVPVFGTLPRLRDNPLVERHMGLRLGGSASEVEAILERLADYVSLHADLDAILNLARTAAPLSLSPSMQEEISSQPARSQAAPVESKKNRPTIGYIHDDALWFYYRENLEALRKEGARLVRLSILDPAPWPRLDGLYMGGGFPELYGKEISASPHLAVIRTLSEEGIPIYAECGGFIILSKMLRVDEQNFPMSNIFPSTVRFFSRPQGLGYVEAVTSHDNPFHPTGSVWRGHEFHYSTCELAEELTPPPMHILTLSPGTGMHKSESGVHKGKGQDGLCIRQTFACYTHLYAPAVPHWASRFVEAARNVRKNS